MAKRRRIGVPLYNRGGLVGLLLSWLRPLIYHFSVTDTYAGFRLVNLRADKIEDQDFVELARAALDLIMLNDPRRANTMRREIKYIVSGSLRPSGVYIPECRACKIHYAYFEPSESAADYKWSAALIASLLIHEATHGRIFSLGIPYNKQTRVRIERLCRLEQKRFANRLKSNHHHFDWELVPEFKASD